MITAKPKLVTTPKSHIPIGVPTVLESGEAALIIKGKGPENFDVISVTELLHQILSSYLPRDQECQADRA